MGRGTGIGEREGEDPLDTANIERNPNATMPSRNLRAPLVGGWDHRSPSRERGRGWW